MSITAQEQQLLDLHEKLANRPDSLTKEDLSVLAELVWVCTISYDRAKRTVGEHFVVVPTAFIADVACVVNNLSDLPVNEKWANEWSKRLSDRLDMIQTETL